MKKLFLILTMTLLSSISNAKTYKIYTPAPAGSGSDVAARVIASSLESLTNDTFVVVNKPGAFGVVAYRAFVADNLHDNVIYMMGGNPLTAPGMENAFNEFKPVVSLYTVHYFVVARKDSNIKKMSDIPSAKNVSNSNNASELLFRSMFTGDYQMISYKSENAAMEALIKKEVDLASVSSQTTLINSYKDELTIFSPFAKKVVNPMGFIVGNNVSDSEVEQLNKQINSVLKKPEVTKFITDTFNIPPEGGTQQHYKGQLESFRQSMIPLMKP